MFVNIIWLVAFAALAVLFGWLVWRARGSSNRIVKWGGGAAAFGTLIVALVTVVVVLEFI